jgi:hypothetical protein
MITARNWREIPQRYRLEAAKCRGCSEIHYPPRAVCPSCHGRLFEPLRLSGEGQILTYSIIHTAPNGFTDEVPYAVAIIGTDEGAKLMAQVVDCDLSKLAIGTRVRAEFRRVREEGLTGVIFYGHKFVPVD